MVEEKLHGEQLARLSPVFDKLLTMMAAARDAFNRHSRARLDELQKLTGEVPQDLSALAGQIKSIIARGSEADQAELLRLQSLLPRVEMIGANIGGLADPIQKKVKDGILFSDKAVTQTNYLFDQHAGMIRSVLDIIKTDNEYLKKFVQEESLKLMEVCNNFATEHQDRLIEGLCQPQAAPIFLAILDRMRTIGQHEGDLAGLMAKKP